MADLLGQAFGKVERKRDDVVEASSKDPDGVAFDLIEGELGLHGATLKLFRL